MRPDKTSYDIITKKYGPYHLSMGDELRAEIRKGTSLGKKLQKIMNTGALVPDEITDGMLLKRSKSKECKKGMIFDGYPRRDDQLQFLLKHFRIDAAIEIALSEKESIERIASRRMCPKCNKNYNMIYLKPKVAGMCDIDGARLIQREDDKPAEIKKRLDIYRKQTEPLKEYYKKQKILHVIQGNRPIKDVAEDIDKILKKIR